LEDSPSLESVPVPEVITLNDECISIDLASLNYSGFERRRNSNLGQMGMELDKLIKDSGV
jgi:hypothetical protein